MGEQSDLAYIVTCQSNKTPWMWLTGVMIMARPRGVKVMQSAATARLKTLMSRLGTSMARVKTSILRLEGPMERM